MKMHFAHTERRPIARVLIVIAATLMLGLALAAGPAPAKTVYEYVYSGESFDGSDTFKSFAESGIDDFAYDAHQEVFLISVGEDPAYVSKFTKAGVASPFSSTGIPTTFLSGDDTYAGFNPRLAVDQSGGPTDGNFYLGGSAFYDTIHGFTPDGIEIPAFERYLEGGCGIAVNPQGVVITTRTYNAQFQRWNANGENVGNATGESSSPNKKPALEMGRNGIPEWSGVPYPTPCNHVIDGNSDIYSHIGGTFGPVLKTGGEGPEYGVYGGDFVIYILTPNNAGSLAIDQSNDDVFAVEPGGVLTQYDSEGDKLAETTLGVGNIAVDPATHDVWSAGGGEIKKFERTNPVNIPDTTVTPVELSDPTGTTAILKGTVNPGGTEPEDETTECVFEFGLTEALGSSAVCSEGQEFIGNEDIPVSVEIPAEFAKRHYYRLSAKNGNGRISRSGPGDFIGQGKPKIISDQVDRVNVDGARLAGVVDPNGGNTTIHFDYGKVGGFEGSSPESEKPFGFFIDEYQADPAPVSSLVTGLEAGETYQFRMVATNEAGSTVGPTGQFTTYVADPGTDVCPNSHARQQTGASLLPDCRAYELVSAANTGGFDVVSDIAPGRTPISAYPEADNRLLYSLDAGVIPGIAGSPTNLGRDPYVATRSEEAGRWSTQYVGLPSDGLPDEGVFGSPLLASDPLLHMFAFGGPDVCDPCFEDGSTNVPLRLPDGSLVEGMAGSLVPPAGERNPAGYVGTPISGNGEHFLFGSKAKFEPTGNEGEVSIYDRNLDAGTTQVVSTLPSGETMDGSTGVPGALDVSADGSRIVVGEKTSTDGAGNDYWHPYMHIGNSPNSVDLAPGATAGVLYNGMTADGTRVFFTTKDKLLGEDTDTSADIYEAEVGGGGSVSLRLITVEGTTPRNDDSCEPPGDPTSWNAATGIEGKCNAVAIAGGAGVAKEDGTFYFVSPELLDGGGNGVANQANLYVVRSGQAPHFVANIDSSIGKPGPQPPNHPLDDATFIEGLKTPESLAVDQSTDDLYVVERGNPRVVSRWDSSGAVANFSAGPDAGTNTITQVTLSGTQANAQVAVDNASGSPFEGDFYVANGEFFGEVAVFASSGEKLGSLSGSGTPFGFFGTPCGVAVDQSSGVVYVADRALPAIYRYAPTGTATVSDADYTVTGIMIPGFEACQLSADTLGNVYASKRSNGPARRFEASEFGPGTPFPPEVVGTQVDLVNSSSSTDPETDDFYVNERNQIARYDSSAELLQTFGFGDIGTNSRGVAMNGGTGHVYATFGALVVDFGFEEVPYAPIDNPAIAHGTQQARVHSYEDFQVSPNGRFAAFGSVVPHTGYPTNGHESLYRYDAVGGELDCVSCPPSGITLQHDTSLAPHGLNLADDGRVFFTTLDELALRDANGTLDVYEWSDGTVGLISTGFGEEDSGLASVSADGLNVFFYTRDELHAYDENGRVIKVYVAREVGGIPVDPPRLPCAASDECHGAGTQQPPPPDINSQTGARKESGARPNRRCANLGRRARRNSSQAKRLRRKASKSSSAKRSRALRRRASRSAKKARQLSRRAKACRRSSGGNGR